MSGLTKLSFIFKCLLDLSNNAPPSLPPRYVCPCSETLMKKATNIARKRLISMGTCVGKFTKTGKFHLQVTALDVIAPYAKVNVTVADSL